MHVADYARFLAHAIAVGLIQLSFLGPALEPLLEACLVKSDVAIAGKVLPLFTPVGVASSGVRAEHVCPVCSLGQLGWLWRSFAN